MAGMGAATSSPGLVRCACSGLALPRSGAPKTFLPVLGTWSSVQPPQLQKPPWRLQSRESHGKCEEREREAVCSE